MEALSNSIKIAIIGAGFGGLCLAAELKKAGIDSFVILEKGNDVGGIWRDNTYPGCGCDVPSHLYSYSFEKYQSSVVRYPGQADILQYLRHVAAKYDLRRHLTVNAEVVSATYSEAASKWAVLTSDGVERTVDVLVSAVGQLHRPKLPDIPDRDRFEGPAFHTANWDHDTDLSGRDVAVIGTGSSAAQLLPHLARQAHRVYLYQRTPSWVIPKPHAEFGSATRWAFGRFPALQPAYRCLTYLAADIALSPVITQGWSFRPANWIARAHLRRQVPRRELRERLTPTYPIGCKRIVIDNDFYPALMRDNVELVTDGIARFTATGIETVGGTHRGVEAIVYATGFRTTEFLAPMRVTGRDGLTLRQRWSDGAEAYLGIGVPGFPNLFLVHGPNTILGHNSNVFIIECQVRYIMNCLRMLPGSVEVRSDAMSSYRRWLSQEISKTVWNAGCQSWYKTDSGRVTNPWPVSTMRYWRLTRADPSDAFTRVGPARPALNPS